MYNLHGPGDGRKAGIQQPADIPDIWKMDEVTRRILDKLGAPGLFDTLVHTLSAPDLNTLLLEVFNRRLAAQQPADLLSKYIGNRLVKPATVNVMRQKEEELQSYRILAAEGFTPVEISPVAQLGTSATVAPVNQKKVLTALRNAEVQSDPTNALALHYAHLKKTGAAGAGLHRFCSITRVLRTQAPAHPSHTPHFSICALTTHGSTTTDAAFEKNALTAHVAAMATVCREVYHLKDLRLEVIPQHGYTAAHPFVAACLSTLKNTIPVTFRPPQSGKSYYYGLQVKMMADINGEALEVGDGGPVNWTQQLLQDRKERMFISGLGLQLLHYLAP